MNVISDCKAGEGESEDWQYWMLVDRLSLVARETMSMKVQQRIKTTTRTSEELPNDWVSTATLIKQTSRECCCAS